MSKPEELNLFVLVIEAKNLKAVNFGLEKKHIFKFSFSHHPNTRKTSDPFCKLNCGKSMKKGSGKSLGFFSGTKEVLKEKVKSLQKDVNRTSVKKKTLDPVWDELIKM